MDKHNTGVFVYRKCFFFKGLLFQRGRGCFKEALGSRQGHDKEGNFKEILAGGLLE